MTHHASNPILRHSLRALLRRPPAALAMLGLPGIAMAGPIGEDVIRGHADITRPDARNTIIDQYTDRAVINWQSFNVDTDEYVIFNQLDASSIVLNRVLGGDSSYILGHIEANGQVFLLNPQGVFFTHGASLDVQGFLASTLDMNPDAFMAGDFTLARSADAPANAQVVNDGQISAGPGGYVVLAGDYTENTGIITASAGTVALVSGNALTLDIEGDGLVSFTVDEATLSETAGVRNAGSLIADGGRVIMTAKVASDLVASAVNNEGLVRARSIEERNGEIYLMGYGGDVVNSGTLDADGENAGGGGIAIYSDRDVVLHDDGVQTAAGDENHSGGVIRAIAEEKLDYQEDNIIRVTGGTSGGFVEVSGHGSLNLRGIPQIGPGGTLLVDPTRVDIRNGSASELPSFSTGTASVSLVTTGWIADQLGNGVDVTLVANQQIGFTDTSGSISVTSGSGDLAMLIGNVASLNGADTWENLNGILTDGPPTITSFTNGIIDITGLDITTGGDITLQASVGTIMFDRLVTTNGNISIDAGNGFGSVVGNIVGGVGGIDAAGSVTIGSLPSNPSYGGDVTLNGAIDAGGDINIAGNRVTTAALRGNNVTITIAGSGARLTVGGNVNASGSASFFNSSINTGSSADITVNGSISADNNVIIDGTRVTVGSISANSVDVSIKGSNASFTANGNITADNEVQVGQFGSGIANITVKDIRASRVWMYADGFIRTGDLEALGSLGTLGSFDRGVIHLEAETGIETGSLVATNDMLGAEIDLFTSFGGITVNGDVTANGAAAPAFADTKVGMYASSGGIGIHGDISAAGYGGPGDDSILPGVSVYLEGYGDDVRIDGGVTLVGHPTSYGTSDESGFSGDAEFYAYANGGGDLTIGGPVKVTGTRLAEVDLYGANVTVGDITVVAEPGSRMGTNNSGGMSVTETFTTTGTAEIAIDTGVAGGIGDIVTGDLSATGPNAEIRLVDATTFTTGAITLNATGTETSFAASYGGASIQETRQGGYAELFVGLDSGSASSTAIDINGGINVSAVGHGSVELRGDTIATRGIKVSATGASVSRDISGDINTLPYPVTEWPYDGEFGGPHIDEGSIKGGAATINISGTFSGSGESRAQDVRIDGDLGVEAPGHASIAINGDDIAISGGIKARATQAQISGEYSDSGSSTTRGVVESSVGIAGVELNGLMETGHATTVGGAIEISGPRAKFNASGGTVTLGDLSVTATGIDVNVHDTTKDSTGNVTGTFSFQGSHLVTGIGVEAVGAANVGDVSIEGPGAAGIIFRGSTITTGSIKVRATAGEFTATTPSYNGGAKITEQTGAAVVGFESPNAATVNGDIVVDGALTAHVGGRANVSGDFTISGGRSVFAAPPAYIDFLDNIDDGDVGEDPLTLSPAVIKAASITASVTNGNLDLGSAKFTTNGAMTLSASGNVNFSGRSQDAGNFAITGGKGVNLSGSTLNATGDVEVIAGTSLNAADATITGSTIRLEAGNNLSVSNISLDGGAVALVAGGNISNSSPPGTITADALAILAGGDVELGNTTLDIGSGSIASVPGDTRFLELLALEGLALPASGPNLVVRARNVTLDGGSLAGDYVYLETNSLAVNGSFTSSNPDLLLQVAPLNTGASFSLEQSAAGGGDVAYFYSGALDAFDAATIALGSTEHTGRAGLAEASGTVDIDDTNLFVLTTGNVMGLDNVLSTGIVKDLATLIGGGFEIPQTDEIDTSQNLVQSLRDNYKLDDDDEEGDEEGEDTDTDTGTDGESDELISRDTADEEMMCQ